MRNGYHILLWCTCTAGAQWMLAESNWTARSLFYGERNFLIENRCDKPTGKCIDPCYCYHRDVDGRNVSQDFLLLNFHLPLNFAPRSFLFTILLDPGKYEKLANSSERAYSPVERERVSHEVVLQNDGVLLGALPEEPCKRHFHARVYY